MGLQTSQCTHESILPHIAAANLFGRLQLNFVPFFLCILTVLFGLLYHIQHMFQFINIYIYIYIWPGRVRVVADRAIFGCRPNWNSWLSARRNAIGVIRCVSVHRPCTYPSSWSSLCRCSRMKNIHRWTQRESCSRPSTINYAKWKTESDQTIRFLTLEICPNGFLQWKIVIRHPLRSTVHSMNSKRPRRRVVKKVSAAICIRSPPTGSPVAPLQIVHFYWIVSSREINNETALEWNTIIILPRKKTPKFCSLAK